jgi:hypothetical protein
MLLAVVLAVILLWGTGFACVPLFLGILLYWLQPSANFAADLAPGMILSAALLAALLASELVRRWIAQGEELPLLRALAVGAAWLLFLSSARAESALLEAYLSAGTLSFSQSSLLVVSVGMRSIYCGIASALAVILLCLVVELPVRWLVGVARIRVALPYAALRQLLALCAISLAGDYIVTLMKDELFYWPGL